MAARKFPKKSIDGSRSEIPYGNDRTEAVCDIHFLSQHGLFESLLPMINLGRIFLKSTGAIIGLGILKKFLMIGPAHSAEAIKRAQCSTFKPKHCDEIQKYTCTANDPHNCSSDVSFICTGNHTCKPADKNVPTCKKPAKDNE